MIIRGLLRPDGQPGTLTYDTVVPNRLVVAEAYKKVAAIAGFRADIDAEIVVDLLIGGLLSHLLAKGSVPSAAVTERMVDVIMEGIRARPQQGSLARRTRARRPVAKKNARPY
jgi:hypothetical protein